jgi:hypothetical protein
MAPIAPHLQRRQRPLPLSPEPHRSEAPPLPATFAECEELHLFLHHRHAVGTGHGLPRAEVQAGLSAMVNRKISDRKLQQIMAAAPLHGFPLASSSYHGYFVVSTRDDVDACINELNSRIVEHTRRVLALEVIRERIVHGQEEART